MKTQLIITILFISSMSSYGQFIQPTTPRALEDFIELRFNKIYKYGVEIGNALKEEKYEKIKPYVAKQLLCIDNAINDLQELQDINESEGLRIAAIIYLRIDKSIISEAIIPFESLHKTNKDYQTKREKLITHLEMLQKQEIATLKTADSLRDEYCRKNNLHCD
jgi:hypothetical protein